MHRRPFWTLALGIAVSASPLRVRAATFSVTTSFEGGSARVLEIDAQKQRVRIMPGGRIEFGWPCWWFVRIDGVESRGAVALEVVGSDEITTQPGPMRGRPLSSEWAWPNRPMISDDGVAWRRGERGTRVDDRMVYTATPRTGSLWFAWGPLYLPADAHALLRKLAQQNPKRAVVRELARSRGGRACEMIEVRALDVKGADGRPHVWVQARQHAWESASSWVAQGFIEWVLGDEPEAAWLRDHADITFVPIMDVDHVATGNGGKDAMPQDHNRDWSDTPHWPKVVAAQTALARLLSSGRKVVFVDLHNPTANHKEIYFYTPALAELRPEAVPALERFTARARESFGNPFPLAAKNVPSGPAYHPLWREISSNWVMARAHADTVAVGLEVPWNAAAGEVADYLRAGAQLGAAISAFLAPPAPSATQNRGR